jgi:hypothetical protein|tara:strand:- start:2233 stop:3243 length:1011 start_codon:yes stop_codon:yes gene_type:complete
VKELRKFIRQVIKEARTKQPGDLPQAELLGLINHVLDGGDLFDFSEKFAGSHAEILQGSDSGKFSAKSKSGRSAGGSWHPPRGKAQQITNQMGSLDIPSSSRRFAFEFIDAVQRPDYINYLIGDIPAAVEYTGELTKAEADSLNNSQEVLKFVSLDDISHDSFNLTAEDIEELESIREELEAGKLNRDSLKSLGKDASRIIAGSISQSLLGGPIEGLIVHSSERMFKIPNPQYSDVQRIQSPLYAMFSGRGGVSKKDIKSRLINADPSDRLLKDMASYLEAVSDLPSGFRTFFTPEESKGLLDLLDSTVAGNQTDGQNLYVKFNKRINTQSDWINT